MPVENGIPLSALPNTPIIPSRIYGIGDNASYQFTPKQVADAGHPFATVADTAVGTALDLVVNPFVLRQAISAQVAQEFAPIVEQISLASEAATEAAAQAEAAAEVAGSILTMDSYAAALAAAPALPSDVRVISAIVSGREVRWARQAGGTCLGGGWVPAGITAMLRHWGVVPGGPASQVEGIKLAFAAGLIILDDGGDYTIDADTIPVAHPTYFEGVRGKTRFIFRNMGGFAGLDGFDVQVPLTAQRGSTTTICNCAILSDAAFGRNGIKTPTNPDGGGFTLYATVRPRFVFTGMEMGSLRRTATVTQSMFGIDGWANCIHMGESADSVVRDITFVQPFVPTGPVSAFGGKDLCSGVRLNAGRTAEGAGPIYHPVVEHITGSGLGRMLYFTGKVVSPRVQNLDGVGNGWGIYCDGPLFNSAMQLDSVGEGSFSDMNINGIYGGIYIEGTDFLNVSGVRCSRPGFEGIEYAGEWVGLKIASGFRQVDIQGFRAATFATSAPSGATFIGVDLNGRSPQEPTGTPGMVNLTDFYLSTGVSVTQWPYAVVLRNVREASIEPPKVRTSGGLMGSMLYIESDHTSITPKIYMKGGLPYTFTTAATYGPGTNPRFLIWPDENLGIASLSQVSAAGSTNISPRNRSNYRQGFAAGSGAYTYDYNVSNDGAVEGQIVSFWVQIAATNSTVRFRDEAGGTRLTLNPNGSTTQYRVDCTWIDLAGTLSMRIQFAGVSIV